MHCLSSNDINISSENFLRKLQHLLDEHAPLKTLTKKLTITFTLIFEKKQKKEIILLENCVKIKFQWSYINSTLLLKRWGTI